MPHLESLVERYVECKDAYYNTATSLMTDAEFDALEKRIAELAPDHPCLKQVGAKPSLGNGSGGGRTVQLPYWMGSLDKFYPADMSALSNWAKRLGSAEDAESFDAYASPKLDGVSGMLVMGGNQTPELYSRGSGAVGSDWTKRLPLIHNGWKCDSHTQARRIVVRGELILSKSDFELHGGDYSTSRAMVNGLLGATRNLKPELMRYVHFVAYAVYEPVGLPLAEQVSLLQSLGLETVWGDEPEALHFSSSEADIHALQRRCSELFRTWRATFPYDTDGVVIQSVRAQARPKDGGNPTNAFAYKEACDEQSGTCTVQGA